MPIALATPPGFSFRRTVLSHGWCVLPPFRFDRDRFVLRRVLRLPSGRIVDVVLEEAETRSAGVRLGTGGPGLDGADRRALTAQVRHMFRLDEDYTEFYEAASTHPAFAWIPGSGAGRLLRSPTVFEDLVKLICTTNCTWSLTESMVGNLVAALGAPAEGGTAAGSPRAFPLPEEMAARPARFYEKEVRAGYRAAALAQLAERVAGGELDVEGWRKDRVPTAELTKQILSVRGAGPYTAENLLKLLGRYEGLAIDSWCRAKYLKLHGVRRPRGARVQERTKAKTMAKAKQMAAPATTAAIVDASMARRYGRFGPWRGLALWCDLTKDWLAPAEVPAPVKSPAGLSRTPKGSTGV